MFLGEANISDTLFDQKSPVHRESEFPRADRDMDITTYRLNRLRGRFIENPNRPIQFHTYLNIYNLMLLDKKYMVF